MNVSDFMAKHSITDADLDRMAEPYEEGTFERNRAEKGAQVQHPSPGNVAATA